jgi:hypothetical protein
MANLARFTAPLMDLDTCYIFDDFQNDQTDISFVDTITDSGSVLMGDTRKGIAVLTPSDASVGDNDEAYLACPNEVFIFLANKPIFGQCYLQFSEANTDDANVVFGFQNAVGANSLIDDGGGPKVSGSTLAIYKVDGGTVWKCVSSTNGTSTVSTSTTTAGGSSYQELQIILKHHDSTYMEATFKCDGKWLKDSNDLVIRHLVTIASATEMQVFVGVKNGGANLETLNVDYIYAHQAR